MRLIYINNTVESEDGTGAESRIGAFLMSSVVSNWDGLDDERVDDSNAESSFVRLLPYERLPIKRGMERSKSNGHLGPKRWLPWMPNLHLRSKVLLPFDFCTMHLIMRNNLVGAVGSLPRKSTVCVSMDWPTAIFAGFFAMGWWNTGVRLRSWARKAANSVLTADSVSPGILVSC